MSAVDPFAGMLLDCTDCDRRTQPTRKSDDPDSVVRCLSCGKKHSTDSLRYVGGV
jgi:DNA-directed RNA polymerase subunit RPC12/RpoP